MVEVRWDFPPDFLPRGARRRVKEVDTAVNDAICYVLGADPDHWYYEYQLAAATDGLKVLKEVLDADTESFR